MLSNNLPVIMSVGPNSNSQLNGIAFYTYDKEKKSYTKSVYDCVTDHYFTVIGILYPTDPEHKVMLYIKSWGEDYFIDYNEYAEYVKGQNVINEKLSNMIYIKKISKKRICDNDVIKKRQNQQIAKVQGWYDAINAKAEGAKLLDIIVDEAAKEVKVTYVYAGGGFRKYSDRLEAIRKASIEYLSQEDCIITTEYRISIEFSATTRHHQIVELGIYNYKDEYVLKEDSYGLDYLFLKVGFDDELPFCKTFSDAKGIELVTASSVLDDITFFGDFSEARYIKCNLDITAEQWAWCAENKKNCDIRDTLYSLSDYCFDHGIEYQDEIAHTY